jgi:chemotaxis protein methyltransferase CheR
MSALGLEAALEPVAAFVAQRTGLVFPVVRRESLATAVRNTIARTKARSVEELISALERAPGALDDLVGEITIAESYFFRAPEQFEILRREVLPEVLGRRGSDHRLRLLSAACAGGEEPYSLAILLEQEGLAQRAVVVGTDISRPSLARAADATYGEWSFRGVPEAVRARYFRRTADRFRLLDELRKRVELSYLNLAEDVCPSRATGIVDFDVIFCRNALIYLAADAVARVAARLFAALAEGGWLFTSASDPPLQEHAPFEVVMTSAGILYRRPLISSDGVSTESAIPPEGPALPEEPVALNLVDDLVLKQPSGLQSEENTRPEASVVAIRALADKGRIPEALEVANSAARRFTTSAQIHYLRAVLLSEAGRDRDAADALRRTLYLDRNLAVAALVLGLTLRRLGDMAGAARSLRQARSLLAPRPADELVPFADGERAGRLLVSVEVQLQLLEGALS